MNYSKDDIIRYLKGEMSHSETHEFEKNMLDDPFLADSVEGFQSIDQAEDIIEEVYEKAGGKKHAAKTISMFNRNTAIAASLALLFISIAVLFSFPNIREQVLAIGSKKEVTKNETLALAEPEEKVANKSSGDVLLKEEEESTEGIDNPTTELLAESPAEATVLDSSQTIDFDQTPDLALSGEGLGEEQELEADPNVDLFVAEDGQVDDSLDTSLVQDEINLSGVADNEGLVAESQELQAEAKRSIPAASRAASILPEGSLIVFGAISSSSDQSTLGGVNVTVGGTNRGTISNADGTYSLQLREGENQLIFSFIGYSVNSVSISTPGEYNVALNSNNTELSEIVAVRSGSATENEQIDQFSLPADGKTAYSRYLADNIQYPESAAENEIIGRVVIEFTVMTNGSLTAFEVVESLGFGCDEEALRLIQDGPNWLPAIRGGVENEERVRVALRFNPPSP